MRSYVLELYSNYAIFKLCYIQTMLYSNYAIFKLCYILGNSEYSR